MRKIVFILCIIIAFTACTKKDVEQKGPYLAKVGNAKITEKDFEREFQALPEYARKIFDGGRGKERFLDEIVKKEMLYQEALKKGLDKEPDFQKKLVEFKKLTLITELFEKEIIAKASVSEQEARDFFEINRGEFTTTAQIRASHILVATEDEANKILDRLGKDEEFADIAKTVSIDKTSAEEGGDLGYFSRGQMVPEFEEVAFNLDIGELSAPVKTPFGYHIIKVVDRKEGPAIEFENIKGMIMQKLANDRQKEVFDKYIDRLKKTYKIEINKDALAKLTQEEGETEKPEIIPEVPAESEIEKPGIKSEGPAETGAEQEEAKENKESEGSSSEESAETLPEGHEEQKTESKEDKE